VLNSRDPMSDLRAFELASLDDIREFERTPALQRYPVQNTYELFRQACDRFSDSLALSFLPTGKADDLAVEVSYRELFEQVTRTANMLHGLGVRPADTVTVLLPTLPETHFALWGGSSAGIVSPVNPMLEAGQITDILNATRSRVLITLGPGSESGTWEKVAELAREVPSLESIVVVKVPGLTDPELPAPPREGIRVLDYQACTAKQDGRSLASKRRFAADEMAMFMHTGGTTGRPKVARLSHGNLALIASIYADLNNKWGQITSFGGLPLFHVFGIIATGLAAFAGGRHMVLLSPLGFRNPVVVQNLWRLVERFQVPVFATVPTVLAALYSVPDNDCDISCLEQIATGAAPLSLRLKRNLEKRFDVLILCGYGMTESSMILSRSAPANPPPEGSVGLRIPYVRVVVGEISGQKLVRLCAPGERGAVLAHGPNMFQGYLESRDNEGTLVDDHWFNTGDLGYMDEAGNLYLTGRAKDLIIRGGHNLDPVIIEETLSAHPAVSDAIAIGQPDPYAGEIPVAFVKLEPGRQAEPDDLLDHCREHISERAAVPKRIEFIDEVPLTAVAKVLKPELRQRAAEFAIRSTLAEAGIQARITARHDPGLGLAAIVELEDSAERVRAESLLDAYVINIKYSEQGNEPG